MFGWFVDNCCTINIFWLSSVLEHDMVECIFDHLNILIKLVFQKLLNTNEIYSILNDTGIQHKLHASTKSRF